MKTNILLMLLAIFVCSDFAAGQTQAEFASGSMNPITTGPTATNQTARFLLNTSGTTYTTPNTTVNVVASITNQQYTGSGTGTGNPVVMFGATNRSNNNSPTSQDAVHTMNAIGSPANGNYSNMLDGSASGIDVATNIAFNFYTSINHWDGASTPSTNNVRIHMADLTLSFNTPLTNPYLHLVGLGGNTSSLGFATELDLINTISASGPIAGSFTKIQGNSALTVTADQINNDVANRAASCSTNVAGCGTVMLNGTNITSVTFRLYVKANGGQATWGTTTNHEGDQWLLAVSLPDTYNLSGSLYNDVNGTVNGVDGTLISAPDSVQMYANLVNLSNNKIIGSTPISSGAYTFSGIPRNSNVRVEISRNQGSASSDPPSKTLPAEWVNTGESPETPANTDGALETQVISSNVTNINFGIEKRPTAANATAASRDNPGGTTKVTVPATTFTASDTSPGVVSNIRVTSFPSNTNTLTINGADYSSASFPSGGVTIPTNSSGNPTQSVQIDPVDGAITVSIPFAAIDNAGFESTSTGAANVPFTLAPTASNGVIAGKLISNGNPLQNALITLIDTESNAKVVTRSDSMGSYRFENVETGRTYIVQPKSAKHNFYPSTSIINLLDNIAEADFRTEAKSYTPKNDFDGDGRSDIAVYRPSEGTWYVRRSSDEQMSAFQFGIDTDIPAAADFDGDGVTDYAVFRPAEGNWYIWQSKDQTMRVENFGLVGDRLVPADFDGDGKADIAVYRNGAWFIRRSSDQSLDVRNFGLAEDLPLTEDFDGDGKTDAAVYRPSGGNWYVLQSSDNGFSAYQFGLRSDVPISGDFDGDGVSDLLQRRGADLFFLNSATGFEARRFDARPAMMVTADYDGDGRTDIAVFQDGEWVIGLSGTNLETRIHFGSAEDIPLK